MSLIPTQYHHLTFTGDILCLYYHFRFPACFNYSHSPISTRSSSTHAVLSLLLRGSSPAAVEWPQLCLGLPWSGQKPAWRALRLPQYRTEMTIDRNVCATLHCY